MADPYTYIRDGEILTGEDGISAKVKNMASEVVNKLKKSLNIDKAKSIEEVPDELINNLVSAFKDGALRFKPGLETKRDNSSFKTTSNQATEINHSTEGDKNVTVTNSTRTGSATWKDGGHATFTLGGDPIVDGGAGAYLDADYNISSTKIESESDPNSDGFNYRGVDVNKSATGHVKTGGHVEVCGRRCDVPIDVHGQANCGYSNSKEDGTIYYQSTDDNKLMNTTESKYERSVGARAGASGGLSMSNNSINIDAGVQVNADGKCSSTRIEKESDPNSDGFNYRGVDVNKSATGHVKTGGHVEVCGRRCDVPIDVHGQANCGYSHSKEDGTIYYQSTDDNKLRNTTESKYERSVGARAGASGGLSMPNNSINIDAGVQVNADGKCSSTRIEKESDPNSDGFNYRGVDVNKSAKGHVKTDGHVEVCGKRYTVPIDVHGDANCGYSHSKEDGTIHNQSTDGHKLINTTESKYERLVGARAGASGGASVRSQSINADVGARFDAGCSVSSKHIDGESLPNIDGYEYEGTETEYAAAAHFDSEAHLNASANVLGKTASVNATGRLKADGQMRCSHVNFTEKSSSPNETRENKVFHKVRAEGSGEFEASVNANGTLRNKSKDFRASVKGKARGRTEATAAEWSYTNNKEGFTGHFEALSAEAEGEAELEASTGSKSVRMRADGRVAAKAVEATADLTVQKDEHKTSIGGVHANIGHFSARGRATINEKSVQAEKEFNLASVNALQAEVREKEHCDESDIYVKGGLVNANVGNAKVVGEKTGKKATLSMDSTLAELNAGNVSVTGIDNRESNRTGVNARIRTTHTANIGNVDITGLGSRQTRFEANTAPGVDAFNFRFGIHRNTGGSVSTNRLSYGNIDLTIGPPNLNVSLGKGFGNIGIPFFGGGGSGGGGGSSRGGNPNQSGEDEDETSENQQNGDSRNGNGTSNGGTGTGGNGTGTGGNGTGNVGNGTGTSGNGTGTSGNGTGTSGNGTGTSGNGTGTGGNGTGTGENGTGGNSTGTGGNGTGTGGNGTGTGGISTGTGGSGTGTGVSGTGTGGNGNGTFRNFSGRNGNGNGTGNGGNGTGNGGNGTGAGGNGTGGNGTSTGRNGTGTSGNNTSGNGTGTGGISTGTGGSGTGTGGNGTGTFRNCSGRNGNGNGTGNGGNGTGAGGYGTGGNGTSTGRNGTGTSGNNTSGNGTGTSGNSTGRNGTGTGGNCTCRNATSGNGTGRRGNSTGTGRNGTGTSGNSTDRGNSSVRSGNSTGTGINANGNGTGSFRNGTGLDGQPGDLNLRNMADQNRMFANLVAQNFPKPSGNPRRSTTNQSSGATPFDWSNTEKIEEELYKTYNPNYTPDDKRSGSSQSGSRDSRKSKPHQKQPPQKPSGSNKNIHTIFTIGAGDSKPIQKLGNNIYGFGNDD